MFNNLRNFRSGNAFKKACYQFISKELLTQREKESLARIYKNLDDDGRGTLDKDELVDASKRLLGPENALSNDECDTIFRYVQLSKHFHF